jgi:biopolymer transport protein ExbD
MRFSRGRGEDIRLGIAPMIDIVFLLLIFFMVTSHFDVASGIRIYLPKATKRIFDEERNKVNLIVDSSGQVYLEGEQIDMEVLHKRLRDLVEKKELSQLILQADKDVRHGKVVEIMDLAKSAGFRSIIIAARWKPGKVY